MPEANILTDTTTHTHTNFEILKHNPVAGLDTLWGRTGLDLSPVSSGQYLRSSHTIAQDKPKWLHLHVRKVTQSWWWWKGATLNVSRGNLLAGTKRTITVKKTKKKTSCCKDLWEVGILTAGTILRFSVAIYTGHKNEVWLNWPDDRGHIQWDHLLYCRLYLWIPQGVRLMKCLCGDMQMLVTFIVPSNCTIYLLYLRDSVE